MKNDELKIMNSQSENSFINSQIRKPITMKRLYFLSTFVLFFILNMNVYAQHQHEAHLDRLVNHYLSAKQALANDDFEEAHKHITMLKSEVTTNSEMNNHPKHAEMHAKHHGNMTAAVTDAGRAENLEQLRAAFNRVSQNLIKAVQNQGYDETMYIQFCPMALNSEGASWLSTSKEVANPYMGQKMPNCGVQKEVLKSESK